MDDGATRTTDVRTLPFPRQVAVQLASRNARGPALWLGRTPASLRMVGFPDLPLRMTVGVLHKIASGKHGIRAPIPQRQLERLPELIDEPVALLDSATVEDAIVVLTSARAETGFVVASVKAGCRESNANVNLVTSVYAKDRFEWLAEQVAQGRLKYVDKTKGLDTLEVSGRALNCGAEPGSRNPSMRNVLLPEDLRKFRKAQRDLQLQALSTFENDPA